jgi:peptidoglycan/LPS O-acetylase OafA/YrhL
MSAFRVAGVDNPQMLRFGRSGVGIGYDLTMLALNGTACVTLFFVLSGTVLSMSLERNPIVNTSMLVAFYIKRMSRLYPLLIFAAIMAAMLIIFDPIAISSHETTWLTEQRQVKMAELPRELALNFIGIKSSLNSPAWSIKVEILGSLMFPLLFIISRSPKATLAAVVALVGLMIIPHDPRKFAYMSDFSLPFLVGSYLVQGGRAWIDLLSTVSRPVRIVIAVVSAACLLIPRRLLDPATLVPSDIVIIEVAAAFALVAALLAAPQTDEVGTKYGRFLGDLSFGIYLLHVPLMTMLSPLYLGLARDRGWAVAGSLLTINTVAITIPLAFASYHLLERRFIVIGQWAAELPLARTRAA